ncbi:MAG: 5'-nucleotidase C-terminal domain-containing protein [Candidatus Ozemobacteraceae bacterium]
MKKIQALLIASLVFITSIAHADVKEPFHVLFYGSMQGCANQGGNYPLAEFGGISKKAQIEDPNLVILNAGNMFGPSALTARDNGKTIVEAMNVVKFDAMLPGPHDLSIGVTSWLERVRQADFPVLWANLATKSEKISELVGLSKIRPSAIFEKTGAKTKIIGVISPLVAGKWPNWPADFALLNLESSIERANADSDHADWVIVGGYITFTEAVSLLEKFPWIDLIITNEERPQDGLSPETFAHQLLDGRRILWSRSPGRYYGDVQGKRSEEGLLLHADSFLVERVIPIAKEAAKLFSDFEDVVEPELTKVITNLTASESQDFPKTVADSFRYELKAEIGLLTFGSIDTTKSINNVSIQIIRETTPFADHVAMVPVMGSVIRDIWKKRNSPLWKNKGLVITGVSEKKGIIFVNGRPLSDTAAYRVATTEYLARGGLKLINSSSVKTSKMTVEELLKQHFSKTFAHGRIAAVEKAASKPIIRFQTNIVAAFNQLQFGGSAPAYRNPQKGGFYLDRSIPGLVGKSFKNMDFDFGWNAIYTRVRDELSLSGENRLSQRDGDYTENTSKMILRWRKRTILSEMRPFVEISSTRPFSQKDSGDSVPPLFIQAVAGVRKMVTNELYMMGSINHLVRESWPSKPKNTGLKFETDLTKKLSPRADVHAYFGYFYTTDQDKIRMIDGDISIKYRISRDYRLALKERFFGWKEASISSLATRNETYIGLDWEFDFRHF